MTEKNTLRYLLYCSAVVLFVYALRSLTEPDIWWQLGAGAWIWEHGQVPDKDVLSYTFAGEPWTNVKWLSEGLYYGVAVAIHPCMINILCGFVFVAILWLMVKRCKEYVTSYAIVWTVLWTGFVFSVRMNGRPEMFSYFFTAFYLFVFHRAKQQQKWLWSLIPAQILWSNMHEAFAIGVVMTAIYIVAQVIQGDLKDRRILWMVGLGVMAGVCVNPRGMHLAGYAWNIYGQLSENSFTGEMSGWGDEMYWNAFTKAHWFTGCLVGIYLVQWWMKQKAAIFKYVGSYEMVLMAMFFYLGVKSNRNIVFFQIAAFPVMVRMMEAWLPQAMKQKWALIALAMGLNYIGIVSGGYYRLFNPNNQFGVSVHPEKTPIGTFQYIAKHGRNKKVFADVMSTNYGMWALRPDYQSYIDLRDLDVFTPSFFKNCYTLYQQPDVRLKDGNTLWSLADSLDKFDYVVLLNNENFAGLHHHLSQEGSGYQTVYADPLATVYASSRTKAIPVMPLFRPYQFESSNVEMVNKIFNPFYVPISRREYAYEEMEEIWEGLK